ncbi:MAG: cobalt-zinc-cadmium efflux system outer membrane protein [Bacteroidia bacterium]|jgi:cobalt-zinc-cadmium efflux system outer membrane protein
MLIKSALTLCVCLFSLAINAQNNEITSVLEQVKQNNNELKAFALRLKGKQFELKSTNTLDDLQVGAYYLPYGEHASTNYTEFQISQSFEFPSVYMARKKLINKQIRDFELAYGIKKQEVLATANKYCIELIALNKTVGIEQIRMEQAKQVYEHIKSKYEEEQVGVLSLNKAKVAWLQAQFVVQEIELKQQRLLVELQTINGGNAVLLTSSEFIDSYNLPTVDSLWKEKRSAEPYLISLQQKEAIALQEIKLSRHKLLPDLTAGFNQQGFAQEYYSGFFGGIAIPIFGNKNKLEVAKTNYKTQQSYTTVLSIEMKTAFESRYKEYTLLLGKYEAYNQTLEGLNSAALLLEAYTLGEFSFTEYYMELQFYRQAANVLLDMEKQLNLIKADLLKHQL